jgi:transcription elongation factor Elf1
MIIRPMEIIEDGNYQYQLMYECELWDKINKYIREFSCPMCGSNNLSLKGNWSDIYCQNCGKNVVRIAAKM